MSVAVTYGPLLRLRELVADCATFQSVVGAANRTEALASVHIPYATEDDPVGDLPRAVIDPADNQWDASLVGEKNYSFQGSALLSFEFRVTTAVISAASLGEVGKDAYAWFANKVGLIIHEMLELAATGVSFAGETHLNVIGITHSSGPVQYEPEETEFDNETASPADHEWFDSFQVEWR